MSTPTPTPTPAPAAAPSSLPETHPPVSDTESDTKTCPVTGQQAKGYPEGHEYIAPKEGDSRSPCPALNTMANHGYLPRSGKNISALAISNGLQACYALSKPLALFLSYGGFVLLRKLPFSTLSLYEIGKHNAIEHDASLVHLDTPLGDVYAPIEIQKELVERLSGDVRPLSGTGEEEEVKKEQLSVFSVEDVARARIRREAECRPINSIRAQIARGEMAIIEGVFAKTAGGKTGIPVDYFKTWIGEERLPEGWRPDHVESFMAVVKRGDEMKKTQERLVKESGEESKKLK